MTKKILVFGLNIVCIATFGGCSNNSSAPEKTEPQPVLGDRQAEPGIKPSGRALPPPTAR